MKKKLKMKPATIIQFFINILFGLIALCAYSSKYDMSGAYALISSVQLAVNVLFMYKAGIPWLSFSMLICFLTYIFHFGNVLLIGIGQSQYCVWDNVKRSASVADYNLSCIYAIFCSGLVVSGILYAYGFCSGKNLLAEYRKSTSRPAVSSQKVLLLGIILFVITIVPSLFMQWNRIKVVLSGGLYSSTRSADSQLGVFYYLTRFFPFALVMILIGLKDNPRMARTAYLIILVYEAICMLSGNRALQMIGIIVYTFVYFNIVRKKKINLRIFWRMAILAYIAAAVLNMLTKVRNFGIYNYDLKSVFWSILTDSPLFAVLGEFGNSQLSVSLAISSFPEHWGYKLGSSYISAAIAAIPNIGGFLDSFQDTMVYTTDIIRSTRYTLGGSYIGELYANFGWFGILGAPFIGIFIGKTCKNIFISIRNQDWCRLIPLLVLFYYNTFWVRNYFYGFVFTYVWTCVYIKLVGGTISRRLLRRRISTHE